MPLCRTSNSTMKPSKPIIFVIALVLGTALSSSVFARGGHGHGGGHYHRAHGGHVGVFIGGPLWYPPPYYYAPYYPYAYPPVVVAPPTYIEQGSQQQGQQSLASGYWYY